MKVIATPLLERDGAANKTSFAVEDDIQPRQFVDLLDQHKALLFQAPSSQTAPLSTDDFGQFVTDLELEYYPYIGGAAPRTIIPVKAGKDIVFTANER